MPASTTEEALIWHYSVERL